ncbi:MAG: hypothetical protein AAF741_06645 [Bacteroidota bacterium]
MNDFILTGIPRSGTTLACLLLSQLTDCVALNEPMRTAKYRTYSDALAAVPKFYAETRHSILTRGKAMARAVDGRMTDNHFSNEAGGRKKLVRKQEIDIDKTLSPNFRLGVKHNALFTILLDDLVKTYPVYALVRNPVAVLGSWNSLDLPASRGEVRAAQWLFPSLAKDLESIPDRFDRQLHILDWYFRRYLSLPSSNVIRYEDIVSSDGRALQVVNPKAATDLSDSLASRNKNKVYDSDLMKRLTEKLLDQDHACWSFYQREEIAAQV